MILTAKWRSCAIQAFKEDQASIGMFNKLEQILLVVWLLVQRPVSLCKHFSGNILVATKQYSSISTQESIMMPSRPNQTYRFISNSANNLWTNLLDEVTLDADDPFDDLLLRVLRAPRKKERTDMRWYGIYILMTELLSVYLRTLLSSVDYGALGTVFGDQMGLICRSKSRKVSMKCQNS